MFTEDLLQFFDVNRGFAVQAVFKRGETVLATVAVIFNDPSQSVEIYSTQIEEAAPFLQAPTASLAAVKRGDTATVNGATYRIERIRPDGTGVSTVYLAE
ncbi:MAG: head-tail joining protein [Acidobacteria bacterium]|nr:head-tail joining protein [Acidobacteriota bacterium]